MSVSPDPRRRGWSRRTRGRFTVAAGTATGLPVGPAQRQGLLLTAAQSLVAVLVNLELSAREAAALSGLFLVQFGLAALVPGSTELLVLALAYLVGAAVLLQRARRLIGPLLHDGRYHASRQACEHVVGGRTRQPALP